MPADYTSTARALALPISSPSTSPSPRPSNTNPRPSWTRHRSTSSRRAFRDSSSQSRIHQLIQTAHHTYDLVYKTFVSLPLYQRVCAIIGGIIALAGGITFLVYSKSIFGWLTSKAASWRSIPGGWAILWSLIFLTAFPPIIGYSSLLTCAGFVYGFPNGWFICSTANVIGSLCSFLACRTVLSKYVTRLVGNDKRFNALALTLKHDGLKILVAVRFCPLPYSLSNGALSTFPTIDAWNFALATALATPKLFIHVFVGSRLAKLGDNDGKMDTSTRMINLVSVVGGGVLGVAVGWIIWKRTMMRARELEAEEIEGLRGSGRRSEEVEGREWGADGRGPGQEEGEEMVDPDVAALMGDDDISLWENEGAMGGYRDEFSDDGKGGGDEEASVGLRDSRK